MPTTVQQLIEDARIRHWSFQELQMPDGALLRFLQERLRSWILRLADDVTPLFAMTLQVAATQSEALVGVDANGNPVYDTTLVDGYAVHDDEATGLLYIDTSEPPIARDPFGVSGATPGWPLPPDLCVLVAINAVGSDGVAYPIELLQERQQADRVGHRTLRVFLSHNRLVPLRYGAPPYSDAWNSVASVQIAYLAAPALSALTDTLSIPEPFLAVLTAALAERMAAASQTCGESDKRRLTLQRQEADAELEASAMNVVGELTASHVVYRRR